ncbi:heparinase II/III domain-containing protein [Devosia sediminis]|uniref:Heparinase II/III family protein n=1 Tax=Devosia sediminis TaxID=2798801 RepID=A0A934IPR9_9HYPH|nr:heparinase II/III family protein [Devosia sediminis]MBJ3784584.1 heparinase II/III family protein [Devosia sediminis]
MTLRRWNVRHVGLVLDATPDFAPFPRSGSPELAALKTRLGDAVINDLIAAASSDMEAPIPALPASLYHEFRETGRREGYEDAQRARRNRLYRLTLAEWLEGQGRFLPALEDVAWARLEETNWAWPAHARDLDRPDHPTLDLAAAMTALDMAELDYLIGERLSPNLRLRIRSEVERRAVGPFLARDDHWWLHTTPQKQVNNWTAVCVAGVVGAALYLDTDSNRLARIVTRGLHSLADYLETFDREGGSSEGPDYWTYGFGNYVVLAQLLHARTNGAIDLLDGDFVKSIARFPLNTMLAPGVWVSFSDSDSNPVFHPGLLTYLAEHLELPGLRGLGMANDFRVETFNQFCWPLRQSAWPLPENAAPAQVGKHDWYDEMGWMMSRLDPTDPHSLCLAAKGGHNDEMHNQNDVGSFMVVSGGKVVLTDPGRGRYSKSYFGPERYQNLFASSRGHSVPMVNGFEQAEGRDHAAEVMMHEHGVEADRLELDMAAAYPEAAGLAALRRNLTLDRRTPDGRVLLADDFEFTGTDGLFQSVLVTPLAAEAGNGTVRIGDTSAGVVVHYDAAELDVAFDRHEGAEKQYQPAVDLTRVVFTPRQKSRKGRLALEISPLR